MIDDEASAGTFVVTDLTEVAALLERDVPVEDRLRFQEQLDGTAPYIRDRAGPLMARIQLAMLFIAQGDLRRLFEARELADADYRDLLVQAEYSPDATAINRWREQASCSVDPTIA